MVAILVICNKGQGQHNCMTSFSLLCLLLHLYIKIYNMKVLYKAKQIVAITTLKIQDGCHFRLTFDCDIVKRRSSSRLACEKPIGEGNVLTVKDRLITNSRWPPFKPTSGCNIVKRKLPGCRACQKMYW